jgi:hypothetical protein
MNIKTAFAAALDYVPLRYSINPAARIDWAANVYGLTRTITS